MSIEVKNNEDGICAININGEDLQQFDDYWYCPKALLKNVLTNDLPLNIRLYIYKEINEEGVMVLETLPIIIERINDSKVHVTFEDINTRKYWNGAFGFQRYMEAKRTIIVERSKEINDIQLDSYEDEGAYISMYFSADIDADLLINAVENAEELLEEVEGATEILLESEPIASNVNNEHDFSIYVVLPILRKLGFTNVKYYHGKKEYGKDFVFARITEFDDLENWGAQIKFGDVNGKNSTQINELVSQADTAFRMPFYSIYTRRQEKISKLAIIISGKFTENAIELICEGIENNALKNNLIFIDNDKIEVLKNKLFHKTI